MLNKKKRTAKREAEKEEKVQTVSEKELHEVTLVIYDLARGLASDITKPVLGQKHAIDVVPHTGVIVYGKEYYFAGGGKHGGGGVLREDPEIFRQNHGNMKPIQTILLGYTDCTKRSFNTWCRFNTKYTGASYNLLRNNCNNFTYDAVTQILYSGGDCKIENPYPNWILQVPERILSSPMGKVIYPILQNMQLAAEAYKKSLK